MADKKQSFQEQHSGFADAVEDFLMGGLDLVVPHARREPLNPMAYVKDVNEWFAPSAQMALDEASGEANYPAWAYALASLPVVGKVGKVAGKVGKTFVWKNPLTGDIEKVVAKDIDEATEIINKEVEKIGGIKNTAEISNGDRGRYLVYADKVDDEGYKISGESQKNDKWFDNIEEAKKYLSSFPKYGYDSGIMDEYKMLKAPIIRR